MKEEAIFAGGCFWGVEADFRAVPGVLDARVGYTGGDIPHPTYEEVCGGKTGHAEGVKVVFDPEKVSYEALVRKFFEFHDPTTASRARSETTDARRRGAETRGVQMYGEGFRDEDNEAGGDFRAGYTQGPDVGHQYRSAIFTLSAEQATTARRVWDELEAEGRFPSPIVTEIEEAGVFWEGEEYHQRYLEKRGRRVCG